MSGQRPTILCIDDELIGLTGLQELLELKGYDVLLAATGRQGLELFASHPVDGVILDYVMPGMNGDAVAARMKQMKSHVPILLLSGEDSLSEAELKSVDGFLCKGEPPTQLLSMLDHLLRVRPPFFHEWLDNWKMRNGA
jgi:CheY-like chemotaxis protein